jgi:hypothetical protein
VRSAAFARPGDGALVSSIASKATPSIRALHDVRGIGLLIGFAGADYGLLIPTQEL